MTTVASNVMVINSWEVVPDNVITEDDTPVDNWSSEKHQRLLTQTLYHHQDSLQFSWPFLLAANVGLFSSWQTPPIVPDVFLSLGVDVPQHWWNKGERSYFIPRFGKAPELVIEIVSNKVGHEDGDKMTDYAQLGVLYYVIYNPDKQLSSKVVRAYQLQGNRYREMKHAWFAELGLGLRLWKGMFEGRYEQWLRWCNQAGEVLLTGSEEAEEERLRRQWVEEQVEWAEEQLHLVHQQAEQERTQRQLAEETNQKLAAKLRELGIDPDTL